MASGTTTRAQFPGALGDLLPECGDVLGIRGRNALGIDPEGLCGRDVVGS